MANVVYKCGGDNYAVTQNKAAISLMNKAIREALTFLRDSGFAITPSNLKLFLYTPIWILNITMLIKLNLSGKYKERWHKKCLCLVEFEGVKEIAALEFDRQSNMDDWLIIEKIEDVVAGTSIPYNYNNSRFK